MKGEVEKLWTSSGIYFEQMNGARSWVVDEYKSK